MSKKINKKISKSKKVNLSIIEDKIDKIILKNKEKLNNLQLNKLDIEKFSLKNKDRDTIFYLRKKNKAKTRDSKDSDFIDDIKTTENKSDQNKKTTDSKTPKDQNYRDKNEETDINKSVELFKAQSKPSTLRELVDSKDFDMVVSDINRLIDKESKSDIKKENEKPKFGENIEKQPQKNKSSDFEKSSKEDVIQSDITPYPNNEIKNKKKQKVSWSERREKKKELNAKKKELKAKKDSVDKTSWDKELINGFKE